MYAFMLFLLHLMRRVGCSGESSQEFQELLKVYAVN